MKKLRTTILCKACFFLTLLLIGGAVVAQNYTFTGPGQWNSVANWDTDPGATFLGGLIGEGLSHNITIVNRATVGTSTSPVDLIIEDNTSISIGSGDTLFIWGNLIFQNATTNNINIEGTIIVRGNLIINPTGYMNLAGNSSFVGVSGSFVNNSSATSVYNSNNSNVYVLGSSAEPITCTEPTNYTPPSINSGCEYGDRTALIQNEDPPTRKLLLGDGPLSATITPTSPTCNGDNDGQLEIQGVGGSFYYQYSIDGGTTWEPSSYTVDSHTFTGLDAEVVYNVQVRDDLGDTHSAPTSITEKPELTFSFIGNPYFCPSATTEFTVTVSGGNPNYTVSVSGESDRTEAGPDFVYSGLASGTYAVNVSDAEGCPTPAEKTFDVVIDNAAPVNDYFPPDVFISYAAFIGGSTLSIDDVMSGPSSNIFTSTSNFDSNSMNLSNYENGRYSFDVAQSGTTPAAGDIIEVQKSTDGGSTFPTTLATYAGEQSGTLSGNINLSDDPALNASVIIRLSVTIATSGLQYDITNFQVIADERINSETYNSGTATYTDDPSGVAVDGVESDDLAADWYCTAAGNEELTVTRRWRATDVCGNTSTWQPQVIHVGTAPTITVGNDTIIDFCNAGNISMPTPDVDDNCPPTGGLDITWEIFNQAGSSVQINSAPLSGISLPYSNTNDSVYTVTWTVTDQAGFTATANQTLTLKPAINIKLINGPYDFCSGEQVVFDVNISGGTGEFEEPTFSIGGTWSGNAGNTSGTFTTDNPSVLGFEAGMFTSFTGQVSDVTISGITGGCLSNPIITFTDGVDFDVHENISTNPIDRVD